MKLNEKVLDAKVHELTEVMDIGRLDAMHVCGNPDHSSLYLKAASPGSFYTGGYAPWSYAAAKWRHTDWDEYVRRLINLGYDGIGEMGAKPVMRESHTPLDSSVYEGFWTACEDNKFPVICHVGDPEEFWSEERTPAWAKSRGWGYFGGDYPSQEDLYTEVENFLTRYPRACVVFPHMLFLSPHMEVLGEFFDKHTNAYVDLAPGVELLYEISIRRGDWRRFFTRHADKILLGTDIGMSKTVTEHLARVWMLRTFLETADSFYTPDESDELLTRYDKPFSGLDLPRTALEKIYSGNFCKLWGEKPREVDQHEAALAAEKEGHVGVAKALKKMR